MVTLSPPVRTPVHSKVPPRGVGTGVSAAPAAGFALTAAAFFTGAGGSVFTTGASAGAATGEGAFAAGFGVFLRSHVIINSAARASRIAAATHRSADFRLPVSTGATTAAGGGVASRVCGGGGAGAAGGAGGGAGDTEAGGGAATGAVTPAAARGRTACRSSSTNARQVT